MYAYQVSTVPTYRSNLPVSGIRLARDIFGVLGAQLNRNLFSRGLESHVKLLAGDENITWVANVNLDM